LRQRVLVNLCPRPSLIIRFKSPGRPPESPGGPSRPLNRIIRSPGADTAFRRHVQRFPLQRLVPCLVPLGSENLHFHETTVFVTPGAWFLLGSTWFHRQPHSGSRDACSACVQTGVWLNSCFRCQHFRCKCWVRMGRPPATDKSTCVLLGAEKGELIANQLLLQGGGHPTRRCVFQNITTRRCVFQDITRCKGALGMTAARLAHSKKSTRANTHTVPRQKFFPVRRRAPRCWKP
jgi:hypothetical protein